MPAGEVGFPARHYESRPRFVQMGWHKCLLFPCEKSFPVCHTCACLFAMLRAFSPQALRGASAGRPATWSPDVTEMVSFSPQQKEVKVCWFHLCGLFFSFSHGQNQPGVTWVSMSYWTCWDQVVGTTWGCCEVFLAQQQTAALEGEEGQTFWRTDVVIRTLLNFCLLSLVFHILCFLHSSWTHINACILFYRNKLTYRFPASAICGCLVRDWKGTGWATDWIRLDMVWG